MPLEVIEQVDYLGKKEGQPRIKNKLLLFERRPGVPFPDVDLVEEAQSYLDFGDDDEDDDFVPPVEPDDILEDDSVSSSSVVEDAPTSGEGDMPPDDAQENTALPQQRPLAPPLLPQPHKQQLSLTRQ